MTKYVVGMYAGHNASVAIGDETGILHAVQEERLCGEKNFWGFPRLALQACLDEVGATARDVEVVAYGGNQVLSRYHSRDDVLKAYRRQETLPGKMRQRVAMPIMRALRPNFGQRALRSALDGAGFSSVPVRHYDHQLTHAATAYYGLRANADEPYLVLTCDGSGDAKCATVRVMGGGRVDLLSESSWEDSLGALYSWVTYGMGFVPLEHEYKLMGMAPYASDRAATEVAAVFHRYLGLDRRGLSFKRKTWKRTNDLHESIFADLKGKRFDHVCAGLQRFTEDVLVGWVENAVRETGVRKVLAAGGVFMNVKANKRIGELSCIDTFESFPSCGDETLSLGAYYLEAARRFGDRTVKPLTHYYLGDDIDDVAAEKAVKASGFAYTRPDDIAAAVAELLASGQPVARCAGRMEFGARALGNRSILADPSNQDVVRVINQMVKKRDFWMPFAPMMLAERADEYIQNPKHLKSRFMTMTFDARDNFRDLIAAVHNADLTCRAQVLSREQNPDMYAIVDAFSKRTGRGVVLNTSFNLHGFPIVRTPEEALHVLRESGLRYLQVGPFLVKKTEAAAEPRTKAA